LNIVIDNRIIIIGDSSNYSSTTVINEN